MLRTTTVSTGMPGGPYYTVQHWSGEDFSAAEAARDASLLGWQTMEGLIANNLTIDFDGIVYVVDEASGQITNALVTSPWQVIGDNTSELAPLAAQGLITHRSAAYVAGRRLVGKVFIPGLTEGAWTEGLLATGATDILEDAGVIWRDGDGVNGMGIYSRTRGTFARSSLIEAPATGAILRSRRT